MEQTAKRALVCMVVGIFLLAACAPAPAATQDAGLGQQLDELSAGLTAAAQTSQAIDQQVGEHSVALGAAAQTGQATEPQTSTPPATSSLVPSATLDSTAAAAIAAFTRQAAITQTARALATPTETLQPPATLTSIPSDTPTGLPASIETLNAFLSTGDQSFDNCVYTITKTGSASRELEVYRYPRLDLAIGDEIIIIRPVNLRTGPTFSNRILKTLRADPTYIPTDLPDPNVTPTAVPTVTPGPTATRDPNQTVYRIISGPSYSNLSSDDASALTDLDGADAGPTTSFSVSGRKYIWWQIQARDQKTTGWVVEASACGLYFFIQPVSN